MSENPDQFLHIGRDGQVRSFTRINSDTLLGELISGSPNPQFRRALPATPILTEAPQTEKVGQPKPKMVRRRTPFSNTKKTVCAVTGVAVIAAAAFALTRKGEDHPRVIAPPKPVISAAATQKIPSLVKAFSKKDTFEFFKTAFVRAKSTDITRPEVLENMTVRGQKVALIDFTNKGTENEDYYNLSKLESVAPKKADIVRLWNARGIMLSWGDKSKFERACNAAQKELSKLAQKRGWHPG